MEQQVLSKVKKENILTIEPYFKKQKQTPLEEIRDYTKSQDKFKNYGLSLQKKSKETFPLLTPDDMPDSAKRVVEKLDFYKEEYKKGNNLRISVDDFWVKKPYLFFGSSEENSVNLVDLLNQNPWNGTLKNKEGSLFPNINADTSIKILNSDKVTNNVIRFNHFLETKKIPFMYIQLPDKASLLPQELPFGYMDKFNPFATEFLEKIKNSIHVLDYRATMLERGITLQESFFRTDRHWMPKAAFHAAEYICHEIKKIIDISFDETLFDMNQYDRILYPHIFLGEQANYTGLIFGGLDDFELYLPKYKTDYIWEVPDKNYQKAGEAKDALLFPLHLDWDYYNVNPYAVYSLHGCCKITNNLSENNKKL